MSDDFEVGSTDGYSLRPRYTGEGRTDFDPIIHRGLLRGEIRPKTQVFRDRPSVQEPTPIRRPNALSDVQEPFQPDENLRVRVGGYMRPGVELNAMEPLQTGPVLPGGGLRWVMRQYPVMVVPPSRISTAQVQAFTAVAANTLPTVTAGDVTVDIVNPFANHYMRDEETGDIREVPFDFAALDEGGFDVDDWQFTCSGPISKSAFAVTGRLVVFPRQDLLFTRFKISVEGSIAAVNVRYVAADSVHGVFTPDAPEAHPSRVNGTSIGNPAHAWQMPFPSEWYDAPGRQLPIYRPGRQFRLGVATNWIHRDAGPAVIDVTLRRFKTEDGLITNRNSALRLR